MNRAGEAVLIVAIALASIALGAWLLAPIGGGVRGFLVWFFACCGIGATIGYLVSGKTWRRVRSWLR